MSGIARKKEPRLWQRIKSKITRGSKGGRPGQWSARKAQLAVHEYRKQGGEFRGKRSAQNHLAQWTQEEWGTKSGRRSRDTGERYLPEKARRALSRQDYELTTRRKREDTQQGRQFSKQPGDVARKTARYRHGGHRADAGPSRADLYAEAQRRGITGRSRMTKAQLQSALARKGRR